MVARIGKAAPEFTAPAVVNQSFQDISLSQYKGKYVVLFFYPLDFTFGTCLFIRYAHIYYSHIFMNVP